VRRKANPTYSHMREGGPGRDHEHVAVPLDRTTNTVNETLMATPALSEGLMYVRGASTLVAISRRR
jgi:hypothetical protein